MSCCRCSHHADPLSAASVNGLRVEIGGKLIEGSVKERGEARAVYNAAVAKGHGAYLLEVSGG